MRQAHVITQKINSWYKKNF